MREEIREVYVKANGGWVKIPNVEGVAGIGEDGEIIYSYVRKKENNE